MTDGNAWRWCPCCGEYKDPRAFYEDTQRKGYAKPTPRNKCRQCTRLQMKKRYQHKIDFVRDYKLERGCVDCGYRKHHYALDFDHLPGMGKVNDVASMVAGTYTLDDIKAEIEKCEVVCSNCHRVRSFDRKQHGAEWDIARKVREAGDLPAPPSTPAPQQLTLEV